MDSADNIFKDDVERRVRESKAAAPASNKSERAPVLPENPGIWLFSVPRTASNLFVKMMSGHSNTVNVEYEFMWGAAMPSNGKYDLSKLSNEEKDEMKGLFSNSLYNIVAKVEKAVKDGKRVFAKEHSVMCLDRELNYQTMHVKAKDEYSSSFKSEEIKDILADERWVLNMPDKSEPQLRTSPWMVPDEFLTVWLPVFLIRHPALVVESQIKVFKGVTGKYDALAPSTKSTSSFRWSRMIYDWYKEHGVPAKSQCEEKYQDVWPIVLDAEDVIKNKSVVDEFCRAAKLNPAEVLYEWPQKSEEEIKNNGILGHFLGTLMNSSGLQTQLYDQKIDIDTEFKKWVEKYGEENAKAMKLLAEDAMDDYMYLWERRLKVDA